MSTPTIRLGFIKLHVPDMGAALRFYGEAFGFRIVQTFDEPDFLEHLLALPGQEAGPNLVLMAYKDGRDVRVGAGHGPVGLVTDDAQAVFDRAVQAGARPALPVFDVAGVKVGFVTAPEGHQIELVQLPAR